jgi:uncharacterized protein with von Willebrand factor type A (vWA) domain
MLNINNEEIKDQTILESIRKNINKITGMSEHLSLITLNGKDLTLQVKYADWLVGFKNKIQLFVVCKRHTSLVKTHTD